MSEERRWLEAERERQLEQLRSTHEKQRKEVGAGRGQRGLL